MSGGLGKIILSIFFTIHFYGFCFGHGFFIVKLIGGHSTRGGFLETILNAIDPVVFWFSFVFLIISHGVSFVTNTLMNKTEKTVEFKEITAGPYRRILLVHIFVLGAGFLANHYELESFVYILLLVAMKVVIDLRQHFKANPNVKKSTIN